MFHHFYHVFSAFAQLNDTDKTLCEAYFEPLTLTKNEVVEEENRVPKHLYFINKGFMRLFYYDDNGDEVTTLIASPRRFITSFLDLINERKAMTNVQCVTDCEVLRMERSQIVKLIEQSENFKKFSIIIFFVSLRTCHIKI